MNLNKTPQMCILVLCTLLIVNTICAKAQVNDSNKIERKLQLNKTDVIHNSKLLEPEEVEIIMKNNSEALALYRKGINLRGNGNALLAGGIVSFVGGYILMIKDVQKTVNNNNPYQTKTYNSDYYIGALLNLAGNGLIAGGIVCKIIGKSKIRRAVNSYNSTTYINNSSQYNLSLGFQSSGIGVKLNF